MEISKGNLGSRPKAGLPPSAVITYLVFCESYLEQSNRELCKIDNLFIQGPFTMCDKRRRVRILFFAAGAFLLGLISCLDENIRIRGYSGVTKDEIVVGQERFWRLKRDCNGVWWFLSPEGRHEFLNTVTTVQPYQKGRDKDGLHYVSSDWKGPMDAEIWDRRFKPDSNELSYWAEKTIERVKEAGFKGLGGWCNWAFYNHDVPVSRVLGVWGRAGKKTLFYSPAWAKAAQEAIRQQVTVLADNTNLVGYFLDNELDWGGAFSAPARYFDELEADNPNRQEVIKVIRSVWPTIEQFNRDWQVKLTCWDELQKWSKLAKQPMQAKTHLREAWLFHLAKDYFEFTTKLIRKYDQNHLILGVRFKGNAPREVCRASRGLTDAQSINIYSSSATIGAEMFAAMYEESGQPVIISEYGFHSLDGRSGNRNRSGFVWGHVIDQKAKADGCRLLTTRLARVPYIIGADWFQWNDEPPSGRGDGEDVNFGIVDIFDRPYKNMVEVIRQTRAIVNDLHAESFRDEQKDIWHKRSSERPSFSAPYLKKSIVLDGDLSEWPRQARLGDIRYLEVVGIERADELVMPEIYLGWTNDGLYIGVDVFDKNVDGYVINEESKKHIWRSRSFDCIEVWFSTRPVDDKQHWYNQYCYDFMFMPDALKDEGGVVMQWHHNWDALEENLVPHPDIKYTVKFASERYIVEMFIPAKVLSGFEPQAYPEIVGNIFVRNWQPRLDYFWACTEFGPPGEWGRIKLKR